jgi:hypothetical protein
MLRASAALSLAFLPLFSSGCATRGDFPSLALRNSERVSGTAQPAAPEALPTLPPQLPPPLMSTIGEKLIDLHSQGLAGWQKFEQRRARAESLVSAAAGAAAGSEAWALAAVALAELESARSETSVPLADLDALFVAHQVADPDDRGSESVGIAGAREQVAGWIAREDRTLEELRRRLR